MEREKEAKEPNGVDVRGIEYSCSSSSDNTARDLVEIFQDLERAFRQGDGEYRICERAYDMIKHHYTKSPYEDMRQLQIWANSPL